METGENPGVAALLLAQPGQKLAQSIKPLLSLLLCRDIFDDGAKRGPDVRLIVGNRLPYITPRGRRERRWRMAVFARALIVWEFEPGKEKILRWGGVATLQREKRLRRDKNFAR